MFALAQVAQSVRTLLKLLIRAEASAEHSEVARIRIVAECVCVCVCSRLLASHSSACLLNVSAAQFHIVFKPAG